MEITARTYTLNILLAFVPDLIVAWIAANLTDSGWSGFFITLLVLQGVYFFFWAKQALWSWLLFWLYSKDQMARGFELFFRESAFPAPTSYAKDFDDYLPEIVDNEDLGMPTRLKAAFEQGTLNGLRCGRRYSIAIQLNSAARVALRRYAQTAKRPVVDDKRARGSQSDIVALEMRGEDLKTIAWLADYGFRVWTTPSDTPLRIGEQVSYSTAESFASLVDAFDRKIVPNLLTESEDDKERRFSAHENRFQTIWESYPEHT